MANEMPLVSVIVPMYNTEQYIGELLGSCLGQTLENFELIIVDNASTDNGAKVVESYMEDFGRRLKLSKIRVNHGPSPARNKGLEMSRGKYVFFMDSDDVIISTALEQMYNLAEKFQTDAINFKRHYFSDGVGSEFLPKIKMAGKVDDETMSLVKDDLAKRINVWMKEAFELTPWSKFLRRDFIIENEIKFQLITQEDSIWNFEIVCLAKKFLMAPNAIYIRRMRDDSVSSIALAREIDIRGIRLKIERAILGIKYVDEFMGKVDGFKNNPELRYRVLHHMVMQNLNWVRLASGDASPYEIYTKLREAFDDDMSKFNVIIPYLISNNIRLLKKISKMQNSLDAANAKLREGK